MDVLSEVLAALELSAWPWFRAELGHPFSVAVGRSQEGEGTIRFHVATEGPCVIEVEDAPPRHFGAGELVLVPGGAPHVLSDAPGREPVPLEAALGAAGFDGNGPLVVGDGAPRTVVVCGEFRFGTPALHPFVETLPPLLHLGSSEKAGFGWVEALLGHLEQESRARRTGHQEVMRRIAEILLIEVLRAHAATPGIGALSALADPQLGRALTALHDRPAADWSLDRLARLAGLSRTVFAERFRERMGMTPMKYLGAWRLQKARRLLVESEASVGEVASRVGYASESAFSRAFREHFRATPGSVRRTDRAA